MVNQPISKSDSVYLLKELCPKMRLWMILSDNEQSATNFPRYKIGRRSTGRCFRRTRPTHMVNTPSRERKQTYHIRFAVTSPARSAVSHICHLEGKKKSGRYHTNCVYIQVHQTTTPDSKQKIFDYNGILLVNMDPKNSELTLLVKKES